MDGPAVVAGVVTVVVAVTVAVVVMLGDCNFTRQTKTNGKTTNDSIPKYRENIKY